MATDGLALEVEGLTKVYGPTIALANASLRVARGEIHGLLGENGAGKSTLVRIIAGVEKPDAGNVRLLGQDATGGPATRAKMGAAFIHQDLGLYDDTTVADTIALVGGFRKRMGVIDKRGTVADAQALIERLDMNLDPRARVGDLTLADQTAVAVARALSSGVELIVLDEPTAYLEAREARRLFKLLGSLRDDGVACLIITHRSEDVLASCDSLTVLRNGQNVASRPTQELSERELIRLITGHAPLDHAIPQGRAAGEFMFQCEALSGAGFRDVSFSVGPGEAVTICGLADAGHFAVGEALCGLEASTGQALLEGRPLPRTNMSDSIRAGVAFVPRDRRNQGLAAELSARENIFMNPEEPWYRVLRGRQERTVARQLMERLIVRPPDPDRLVGTFSGGNQQKILLAKWIKRGPRLMILNEPTAGIDVGAKAEIQARLRELRAETGMAIIVITSDFSEVADISDRALVMRHGYLVGQTVGAELGGAALTELAYGGTL